MRDDIIVDKDYFLCPVCGIREGSDEGKEIECHVIALRTEGGRLVHYPKEDTVQSDPHGINSCLQICDVIITAPFIWIWWDPTSEGSLFDLGIVYALKWLGFEKEIVWIREGVRPSVDPEHFAAIFDAMLKAEEVHLRFDETDPEFLFTAGLLFALLRLGFRKRVILLNDDEVRPTPKKSFENVFRLLVDSFRVFDFARKDAKDLFLTLPEVGVGR